MLAPNCRVNRNLCTLMSQTANNAKLLINFYIKKTLIKKFLMVFCWRIILTDFWKFFFLFFLFFFFFYWLLTIFFKSFSNHNCQYSKLFEISFKLLIKESKFSPKNKEKKIHKNLKNKKVFPNFKSVTKFFIEFSCFLNSTINKILC